MKNMRTIKFRGKHLCGQWYYGNLIIRVVDSPVPEKAYRCICIGDLEDGSAEEVEDDTIGQFTGLLDKNGKEIYEGDIMLFHGREYFAVWDEEEARFVFTNKTKNRLPAYKSTSEECFEIIGNIHDNPELIKQLEL